MSFTELPSTEYTHISPLLDYLSGFTNDQLFENVTLVPVTDFDKKFGYEEIVYSDLNTLPPAIYEDISDDEDESTDSISSMYTSHPNCIAEWNSDYIMKWILELYDSAEYRYEDLNLHHFKKCDGTDLMKMKEADWEKIDKKRSKWLYDHFQKLVQLSNENSLTQSNEISSTLAEPTSSGEETDPNPPRRRRGRPRKLNAKRRPEQKIGRVWEFLRNLLQNPEYCPSLIYWEDYQTKKFRLVDGQKVAELWGRKKNNPNMNYEKFSRTIRHYYKDNVIISVPKEKLVYRFGANARGIEMENPNFGKVIR